MAKTPLPTDGEMHKQEVVALLKRINGLLVSSDIPDTTLSQTRAQLAELAESLEHFPDRCLVPHKEEVADYLVKSEYQSLRSLYTPVSGRCNALSPDVTYFSDPEQGVATAVVKYSKAFEGGPGLVHGGFVAALFDELFGVIEHAAGKPSMTIGLDIRYLRPTPLYTELHYEARVIRREGRKSFMKAELKQGDKVLVQADAAFLTLSIESEGYQQVTALAEQKEEVNQENS
ncbi:PaaI family thioesterase [Endozoicomonas arenosclerae]|uniref:PaaI family thioesterase n=1 Tax=Endozoicomonas arenosclerae TaxID=1633495 RepID=UPI0007849281|nr:PaaI family thioesterase [Endozoicomonas arenosclerae]